MTYKTATTCRCCGSSDLQELFSLGEQYPSDFVSSLCPLSFKHPQHDGCNGIPLEKVPITLDLCRFCTLVQARHSIDANQLYGGNYWYRSGVTQTMRDALRDVTRAIEERVDLQPGDVVLDIGSNDGTLLRSYSKPCQKFGVEPAKNLQEAGQVGVDVLIPDLWPLTKYDFFYARRAKVITALGMMYDLENPNSFIQEISRVLAPDGVFVAQLMCLRNMVDAADVGNLAHEHLEFYGLRSLYNLFQKHGLCLTKVEQNTVNGGSYRLWVEHDKQMSLTEWDNFSASPECKVLQNILRGESEVDWNAFYQRLLLNKTLCVNFIRQEVSKGRTVWVYGASTKGNVILQWYGLDSSLIAGAADRSPEKWGKYTVGTGIPISSEETMRHLNPDYLLVLPYAFLQEFIARERAFLERGGKFILPLPEFKVVGREALQCKRCGTPFPPEGEEFCSWECGAAYHGAPDGSE